MKYYRLALKIELRDSEKHPDKAQWDRLHNNMFCDKESAHCMRVMLRGIQLKKTNELVEED